MSYTKTTWSDGDIITANKMNNIETGVESLNTDVGQLQTDLDSLTEAVENLPTGGDYQELVDNVADLKADLSESVSDLKSAFNSVANNGFEDKTSITINWTGGGYYRISDGGFIENEAYVYAEINISENEQYVHFVGTPLYYACGLIFMDNNGKVGDSVPASSSTTPIDTNIKIPSGATKIRISKLDKECSLAYSQIQASLKEGTIFKNTLDTSLNNNLATGKFETQNITFGQDNKYINCNNGVISDAGGSNVHVSDYIDCSAIPAIRLTASPYYSFCCMAFYDSAKTFIQAYPSSSSNTNYWMEEIAVPSNAKYVVFGNNSAISGKLAVKIEFMTTYSVKMCKSLTGKTWVCVGDSHTEINDRATMRYMDYVQEVTGIKTINMGKSGTGYANRHAQSEAFIDRVVNVPTDADVVTIYGSFNDVFSSSPLPLGEVTDTGTTTLCGFINGTIDALYTHAPDCVLGIVTPCPWENSNPANTTSDASKYVDAIIEIAKRRGIPCLDLFHCSGLRPWESSYRATYYSRDEGNGVHPNELGHKLIAPRFEQFIKTLLLN